MKTRKYWIAINRNGRILRHTLSGHKSGIITDFIRRHRRHYTEKQLRDSGITIVRCELHFPATDFNQTPHPPAKTGERP